MMRGPMTGTESKFGRERVSGVPFNSNFHFHGKFWISLGYGMYAKY